MGDIIEGVYHVFRHAETLLDKLESNNSNRVISLSNQGIGLLDFGTNPKEGKGRLAIEEAEKQTEAFFKRQEEQVAGLIPLSSEEIPDICADESDRVQDPLVSSSPIMENISEMEQSPSNISTRYLC